MMETTLLWGAVLAKEGAGVTPLRRTTWLRRFLKMLSIPQLYNAKTIEATAAPESTIVRICKVVNMVAAIELNLDLDNAFQHHNTNAHKHKTDEDEILTLWSGPEYRDIARVYDREYSDNREGQTAQYPS